MLDSVHGVCYGSSVTTKRRPVEVSVHDWQHQLIAERTEAWKAAPKRSGIDKLRRREAEKRAYWTITGHLAQYHGVRSVAPQTTIEGALRIHEGKHNG